MLDRNKLIAMVVLLVVPGAMTATALGLVLYRFSQTPRGAALAASLLSWLPEWLSRPVRQWLSPAPVPVPIPVRPGRRLALR